MFGRLSRRNNKQGNASRAGRQSLLRAQIETLESRVYLTANYLWASTIGGLYSNTANAVAVDQAGNSYAVGYYSNSITVTVNGNPVTLTSNGGLDVLLGKWDSSGHLLWVKSFGGTGDDAGTAITVDAADNLVVVGSFSSTVDFDPNPGVSTLTSVGNKDVFVSKFTTDGNLLWAKAMGGVSEDEAVAVTTDASGNIYTFGNMLNSGDFDPGPGVAILTYQATFWSQAFISKLDTNGNYVWAKALPGESTAGDIALDGAGNLYVTGYFYEWIDLDVRDGIGDLVIPNTDAGMFVGKLDSLGNCIWAEDIANDTGIAGWSIAVDSGGNVYVAGDFYGPTDFDPTAGTYNVNSGDLGDAYVLKLDTAGGFVWVKTMGGPDSDSAGSVVVDNADNVYVAGYFRQGMDFDPGAGTVTRSVMGGRDAFVEKLDSNGNYLWVHTMGGDRDDDALGLALDNNGHVFVAGYFYSIMNFDPGTTSVTAESVGNDDLYVLRLDESSTDTDFAFTYTGTPAWGSSLQLTATLRGATVYPTGTIEFIIGAMKYTASLDTNGQAQVSVNDIPAGNNNVYVHYLGDGNYNEKTSVAFPLTVSKVSSTTVVASTDTAVGLNDEVTLNVTVTPAGGSASGTVLLKEGATLLDTGTLDSNGQYSFVISTLLVGTHNLTVVYQGDNNVNTSTSSPLTVVVNPFDSATALTLSEDTVTYNSPVTLQASVSSTNGVPTGFVVFKDGTRVLATIAIDGSGIAEYTISTLGAGTHNITATYQGDASTAVSVSNITVLTIDKADSTVTMTSSVPTIAYRNPITMTITVTSVDAISSGTVYIYEDGTLLGQATLNAQGQVQWTTTYFELGDHTIYATFGDANHNTADSSDVTFTITRNAHLLITGTDGGAPPWVKIYDAQSGVLVQSFLAYIEDYWGSVRVASGDVNGDGTPDVITATGRGGVPLVNVFDGLTGQLLGNFWAYVPDYRGGVQIAVADVNGDGIMDIVTATDAGGVPLVNVFDYHGTLMMNFWAYDQRYLGGVRIAAGDFNNDGKGEIVTSTASGGLPLVNVFNWVGQLVGNFWGDDLSYTSGFRVSAGDVNGDGVAEVILGKERGNAPEVRIYQLGSQSLLFNFNAYALNVTGGVRVAAVDTNADGIAEIVTAPGAGSPGVVRIFDSLTGTLLREFTAYDNFTGGLFIGAA